MLVAASSGPTAPTLLVQRTSPHWLLTSEKCQGRLHCSKEYLGPLCPRCVPPSWNTAPIDRCAAVKLGWFWRDRATFKRVFVKNLSLGRNWIRGQEFFDCATGRAFDPNRGHAIKVVYYEG